MLRKQIMKRYIDVDVENVFHVISHNPSIYIKLTLRILLFLFVFYVLFVVLNKYITRDYLSLVFGILWIIFFVKYIIDFLNIYLDWLILSEAWITMFMREWLFEYKTDFFEWNRIQTVSHTQNSFRDKLFAKWDLVVRLEHEIDFPFENVNYPQKQVEKILKLKQQYDKPTILEEPKLSDDKMAIIAEALSEVVKEYMDKKTQEEEDEEEY